MAFDPRPVLEADFPSLAVDTAEELGEGWDHVAYLVNGDLVFRLPWAIVEGGDVGEPESSAAREIGLLQELADRLPVAIPEPVLVAPGDRYFGYRYLPGPSLDTTVDGPRPPGGPFVRLLVDIAVTVERLVPPGRALALGLARDDRRDDLSTAHLALGGGRLTDEMRRIGDRTVAVLGERWRAAAARRSVTIHGDFGLDHFIVNGANDVYALIDWTDACVAPAEANVSALMWHVPSLAADAAVAYEAATGAPLDRELVFATGFVNALGDLGELEREDPEGNADDIAWCLQFLRTWSDPDLIAALGVSEA